MSYEGFMQVLCENGHYSHEDDGCPMFWKRNDYVCHALINGEVCGSTKYAWSNPVDETNGADPDTGDCPGYIHLEIKTPAVKKTCNMGHDHLISHAVYHIPS